MIAERIPVAELLAPILTSNVAPVIRFKYPASSVATALVESEAFFEITIGMDALPFWAKVNPFPGALSTLALAHELRKQAAKSNTVVWKRKWWKDREA
jgi:hypothetical protein